MIELAKKHKPDKMTAMAQDAFSKGRFKDPAGIVENMVKIVLALSLSNYAAVLVMVVQ